MAVDMFIKIKGIDGESMDSKHKGEIDVLAWSWGASNSGTRQHGSGGGAGKANIQDLSLTKWLDKASPLLLKACCLGDHITNADLVIRKAGGKSPVEYVKIALEDVLISSISTGGSGGEDRLTENITINFAKVQFTYTTQKADGSPEGELPFKFDIPAHEAK
jgi:type VI secretion system secreted protein Hcp